MITAVYARCSIGRLELSPVVAADTPSPLSGNGPNFAKHAFCASLPLVRSASQSVIDRQHHALPAVSDLALA